MLPFAIVVKDTFVKDALDALIPDVVLIVLVFTTPFILIVMLFWPIVIMLQFEVPIDICAAVVAESIYIGNNDLIIKLLTFKVVIDALLIDALLIDALLTDAFEELIVDRFIVVRNKLDTVNVSDETLFIDALLMRTLLNDALLNDALMNDAF